MIHSMLLQNVRNESDSLLDWLTSRQFVRPHDAVEAVLERAETELGHSRARLMEAADRAEIDPAAPIGRLRRADLQRLARSAARGRLASMQRVTVGA